VVVTEQQAYLWVRECKGVVLIFHRMSGSNPPKHAPGFLVDPELHAVLARFIQWPSAPIGRLPLIMSTTKPLREDPTLSQALVLEINSFAPQGLVSSVPLSQPGSLPLN
jgi:hypothetical protein